MRPDIVCISMTTWEGDYMKTIVHMMSHLAKDHRVLFVDYPFTYKACLLDPLSDRSKRMLGVKKRLRKMTNKHGEVFHLTLPPILPTNWIGSADYFKKEVARQSEALIDPINAAIKEAGMNRPLVINAFNPIIGLSLAGKLNESGLIYYCYDEIAGSKWCGKHGAYMESAFIPKCDHIVTTSTKLYQTKSRFGRPTSLIKNGVDFDLFNLGFDISRLSRKTKNIAYIGSVDARLDIDLLHQTISRLPDHQFHFIGRVVDLDSKRGMEQLPNVCFHVALGPNELAHSLKEMDLGLIPFVKNEFTASIYPLKINEYLAAGLPVVSTNFADLTDFETVIDVVNSAEEMVKSITESLSKHNLHEASVAMSLAKTNDWSSRAKRLETIIEAITYQYEKA